MGPDNYYLHIEEDLIEKTRFGGSHSHRSYYNQGKIIKLEPISNEQVKGNHFIAKAKSPLTLT